MWGLNETVNIKCLEQSPEQSKYLLFAVFCSSSSCYQALHAELSTVLRGQTDLRIQLPLLILPLQNQWQLLVPHLFLALHSRSVITIMHYNGSPLSPAGGQVLWWEQEPSDRGTRFILGTPVHRSAEKRSVHCFWSRWVGPVVLPLNVGTGSLKSRGLCKRVFKRGKPKRSWDNNTIFSKSNTFPPTYSYINILLSSQH